MNSIMLSKLYVDNFKALNNFEISFNKFNIIIGNNSAGKSTILQAIDFLKYACTSSIREFLTNRNFEVSDICSQFSNKRTISFTAMFTTDNSNIKWSISFAAEKEKNTIQLKQESVYLNDKILLSYNTKSSYVVDSTTQKQDTILTGAYPSSIISIINDSEKYPVIMLIKDFFRQSEILDLLSPVDMRKNTRKYSKSIGQKGEKLPSYINQLALHEKEDLITSLNSFFPNMNSVDSVPNGPGWVHLNVKECYNDKAISITSNNISDGIMRLIALFSLKYVNKNNGIMILDEIEDGINSENVKSIYILLHDLGSTNNLQIIVTTHSTVLLDYANQNDILYIGRTADGNVVSAPVFQCDEMEEKLEYCYPGEAILNSSNDEILKYIQKKWGRNQI